MHVSPPIKPVLQEIKEGFLHHVCDLCRGEKKRIRQTHAKREKAKVKELEGKGHREMNWWEEKALKDRRCGLEGTDSAQEHSMEANCWTHSPFSLHSCATLSGPER